jgi:hypothetical protein
MASIAARDATHSGYPTSLGISGQHMSNPKAVALPSDNVQALAGCMAVSYPRSRPSKADRTALNNRMQTMQFQGCTVRIFPESRYLETVYRDGTKVPAVPHNTEVYAGNARKYGYGEDTFALCREHEILHTFLAEKMGLPHSPTLWAVAHDFPAGGPPENEFYIEEQMVLDFQTALNDDSFHAPSLDVLGDLEGLKSEARKLLR